MKATTYQRGGEWWVLITVGEEDEVAGPFEDEYDAEMMAHRVTQ